MCWNGLLTLWMGRWCSLPCKKRKGDENKAIKPTNQMQTFQIQLGKPRVCFDLTWKFNQLLYSTAFGEPSSWLWGRPSSSTTVNHQRLSPIHSWKFTDACLFYFSSSSSSSSQPWSNRLIRNWTWRSPESHWWGLNMNKVKKKDHWYHPVKCLKEVRFFLFCFCFLSLFFLPSIIIIIITFSCCFFYRVCFHIYHFPLPSLHHLPLQSLYAEIGL